MKVRRTLPALAALLATALPAAAHDFWIQPAAFRLSVPGVAPMTFQIGHGAAREAWSVKPARVVQFHSVSATGALDLRPIVRDGDAPMRTPLPAGRQLIVFESNPIPNTLPAERFNAYLEEEGLTPAIELRRRTRAADSPGREIYSRRAKSLVQVGAVRGAQPHVTRPVGLTLEIVPERDPYTLRRGEALPVRVWYQGQPLAGALVKLTDLGADERPLAVQRTDANGRASFRPTPDRDWLLNVVWTRPLAGDNRADFDTVFSSLSFGYPRPASR